MKIPRSLSSEAGWILALFLLTLLGRPARAGDSLEENPKYVATAQRFQADFGVSLKVWHSGDSSLATDYQVTALTSEHLENVLQVLTWIDVELKRYPAGFLKRHGSRYLVLANAYIPKTWKGPGVLYSPAFIVEKRSASILVTVPSVLTPTTEILGKGYLHQTLFTYLLVDVKTPGFPLALEHWKTLASEGASLKTESAKRLVALSNQREGLFKILWEPFEVAELSALAKTDTRLKQRMELVQGFLRTLDPQFDQAFWATVSTIPESQRTVCLNDLSDLHCADQLKADPEIQDDLRAIEKNRTEF